MVIWKYPLPLTDTFELELPDGFAPLSIQTQHGGPTLWALVDPEAPRQQRRFTWHGTGQPLPAGDAYLGTVLLFNDGLVLHLFLHQEAST